MGLNLVPGTITSGAFQYKDDGARGLISLDKQTQYYQKSLASFDASRSSSTYQNNAPVQPNSTSVIMLVKY